MRVITPGHAYELDCLDSDQTVELRFVNRGHDQDEAGPSCQEVIRALIDRVQFLHVEKPHQNNSEIVRHLRQSLVLFEARALERKVEKGQLEIEKLPVGSDGHIQCVS
jgi:hypothetical protein